MNQRQQSKNTCKTAGRVLRSVIAAAILLFSGLAAAQDKVAVLYLYPNDVDSAGVYSQSDLENHFDGPLADFWNEQSYGRYSPDVDIYTWQMPLGYQTIEDNKLLYVIDTLNALLPDNGSLVIPGFSPDDYDLTFILLGGNYIGFAGGYNHIPLRVNGIDYASVPQANFVYAHPADTYYSPDIAFSFYNPGDPYEWINGGEVAFYPDMGLQQTDYTLLHEWGHGLGLTTHANYWRSEQEPLYGAVYWDRQMASLWNQADDYGNYFDIMGGSTNYALHINSFYKDLVGWFAPDERLEVTSSTLDIALHPLQSQSAGQLRTVVIPAAPGSFVREAPFDSSLDYAFYVEQRQGVGLDRHLAHPYLESNTKGLMVYMSRRQADVFINSWLLDMSPDNDVYDPSPTLIRSTVDEDDHHQASLNPGRAFYDEETQTAITNIRSTTPVRFDLLREVFPGVPSGVHPVAVVDEEEGIPLAAGTVLYSNHFGFEMKRAPDGGLSIIHIASDTVRWTSSTTGLPINPAIDTLRMVDGNLELVAADVVIWSSGTAGNPGARAIISLKGQLIIEDADGTGIWPMIFSDGFEAR